ncbi:hypothetical protein ACJX0J_007308 [Zea mays]
MVLEIYGSYAHAYGFCCCFQKHERQAKGWTISKEDFVFPLTIRWTHVSSYLIGAIIMTMGDGLIVIVGSTNISLRVGNIVEYIMYTELYSFLLQEDWAQKILQLFCHALYNSFLQCSNA